MSVETDLADLGQRLAQVESIVMKLGPAVPDLLRAAEDIKTFNVADLVTRIGAVETAVGAAGPAIPDVVAAVADLKDVVAQLVSWAQSIGGENVVAPAANAPKAA